MKAIACLLVVLLLTACRPAPLPAENPVPDVPKTPVQKITVLAGKPFSPALLEKAAGEFSREHPFVTVEILFPPKDISQDAALTQLMHKDAPPTLFLLRDRQDFLNWKPILEPFSPDRWTKTIFPPLTDPFRENQTLYGVPASVRGLGVVCDRFAFQDAGLDVLALQDASSLPDAFARLAEDFPHSVSDFPAGERDFLLRLYGAFAGEKAEAQLHSLVDLMAKYSRYHDRRENLSVIRKKDVVDYGLGTRRIAAVPAFHTDCKTISADGLYLLPILDDAIFVEAPAFWCINRSASPEEKNAAHTFLAWLYTSKTGAALLTEQGLVPVMENYPGPPPTHPLDACVLEYLCQNRAKPIREPVHGEAFLRGLHRYLAGKLNWEEVLQEAAKDP